MPKKIATPTKEGDPKEQPVRRHEKEEPQEPDDRKNPPRDTRETPAPNPNGEPADGPQSRPTDRDRPGNGFLVNLTNHFPRATH